MTRIREIMILLGAWGIGMGFSLFTAAINSPFQSQPNQSIILVILIAFFAGAAAYFGLQSLVEALQAMDWIYILALLLVGRFVFKVVEVSRSFPNLFQMNKFNPMSESMMPVLFVSLLSLCALSLFMMKSKTAWKYRTIVVAQFLKLNARGIILGTMFFAIYYVLALVFNRQDFNTNNVYFAADTDSWKLRLATEDGYLMGMRAVHPLAFLILRPLVIIMSAIFGSDLFATTLFLLAFTGAFGVFFAWVFLYRATANQNLSFLFSALFGMSTTQLMFGSIIESYAFSAFFLILFFVFLGNGSSLKWLVPAGIGVFGITLSNLVQVGIGVFAANFKVMRVIRFTVLVVVISAGLNLASQVYYPNSGLFFKPAEYAAEAQFYVADSGVMPWLERSRVLASDMFQFSVVAPQPFVRTYHRYGRSDFPRFNFMQGERLSRYVGLGKISALIWLGVFTLSVFLHMRAFFREGLSMLNRLSIGFLGCLGFNFLFHMFYGFEPFLYSADWTYALIFLAALGLRSIAGNKWMQLTMVLLIALLSLNNLSFLHFLMSGISPFISGAGP